MQRVAEPISVAQLVGSTALKKRRSGGAEPVRPSPIDQPGNRIPDLSRR